MAISSPRRWLVVGDVGRTDAYHVGDESMLLGLVEGIRAEGVAVEWTVIGDASVAGPDLDVDVGRHDALIIAGGGNLSPVWPDHVRRRAALVRAARLAGRPVVVTGQTIGPVLTAPSRDLVGEILSSAALVGVREEDSYRLALALGVPPGRLSLQVDDASGLEAVAPSAADAITGGGGFIAFTLNPLGTDADGLDTVPRLAAQLVDLAGRTGVAVVIVPHVGHRGGAPAHDVAVAHALVAAGRSPALRAAPLPSPPEAVWYCKQADLVVSSRYHPLVFATAAGTPALLLHQDLYTRTKGEGALAHVGLQRWSLPVGEAALGLLLPAAVELWEARASVRAHLEAVQPAMRESIRRHHRAVLAALSGAGTGAIAPPVLQPLGPSPQGEWFAGAHDALRALGRQAELASALQQIGQQAGRAGTAEAYARTLTAEVERKNGQLVTAHAALEEAFRRAEAAEARAARLAGSGADE